MATQKADDRKQAAAFRKAAREAGCDDNEKRFQSALRTVAKAKPSEKDRQRSSPKDRERQ
jgi:hypothetical protein